MDIMDFVKPELVVVAVVCYFIGMALKNTTLIKDKYIPLVLGAAGIVLACVWVFATSALVTPQDWFMALFAGITQGVLTAGVSTYVNQIIKQLHKTEE